MNKFTVSNHDDNRGIVLRHPNGEILCEFQTPDCIYRGRPDLARKIARKIAVFLSDADIPLE